MYDRSNRARAGDFSFSEPLFSVQVFESANGGLSGTLHEQTQDRKFSKLKILADSAASNSPSGGAERAKPDSTE